MQVLLLYTFINFVPNSYPCCFCVHKVCEVTDLLNEAVALVTSSSACRAMSSNASSCLAGMSWRKTISCSLHRFTGSQTWLEYRHLFVYKDNSVCLQGVECTRTNRLVMSKHVLKSMNAMLHYPTSCVVVHAAWSHWTERVPDCICQDLPCRDVWVNLHWRLCNLWLFLGHGCTSMASQISSIPAANAQLIALLVDFLLVIKFNVGMTIKIAVARISVCCRWW